MRYIRNLSFSAVFVLIFAAFAAAQTEADLKAFFEGKRVEVKIDMPATKDGINIYPERRQPIDFDKYSQSLKNFRHKSARRRPHYDYENQGQR